MTSEELIYKIKELYPRVIVSLNLEATCNPTVDFDNLPEYQLEQYADMVTNEECTIKDLIESYYKDCYDEVLDIDCEDVEFTYEH